ncbi:MAG: hypothetical protein ACRYFK_04095 [Janthinobacterium lividum]
MLNLTRVPGIGLTNVAKLPYDHHELMAMIAPRALLVMGNRAIPT